MILKIKGASSSISLREGSNTIPLKKKDKYFQAEIEPKKHIVLGKRVMKG